MNSWIELLSKATYKGGTILLILLVISALSGDPEVTPIDTVTPEMSYKDKLIWHARKKQACYEICK